MSLLSWLSRNLSREESSIKTQRPGHVWKIKQGRVRGSNCQWLKEDYFSKLRWDESQNTQYNNRKSADKGILDAKSCKANLSMWILGDSERVCPAEGALEQRILSINWTSIGQLLLLLRRRLFFSSTTILAKLMFIFLCSELPTCLKLSKPLSSASERPAAQSDGEVRALRGVTHTRTRPLSYPNAL